MAANRNLDGVTRTLGVPVHLTDKVAIVTRSGRGLGPACIAPARPEKLAPAQQAVGQQMPEPSA